jgi:hypothetical protein
MARKGWLYNVTISEARFRASGLDAAYRIARRAEEALRAHLENDPEVLSVEKAPHLSADSAASNFREPDAK